MGIKDYLDKYKDKFKPWLEDGQQGRVDLKILPYLQDIENGVFVEAGALDGVFMSNTLLLEELGWTGLLVEPSNKAAKECKKNRSAVVEECALVSSEYNKEHVLGDFLFDGESGSGAWSSITRNTYGYRQGKVFHPMGIYVKAKTLASLLKKHKIKKVDFLSLDVEGYEMEVLKGIDFSEVEIKFILVEVNLREYTLEAMDTFLGFQGYKNLGCLSGFTKEMEDWDGSHSDYLYVKS